MKTVVGMFSDANEAQRTLDELVTSGFGLPNISVVTSPGMRGGMRLELMALDASDAGRISARGPLADSMAKQAPPALSTSLRSYGLSTELADHCARAVQRGETLESLVVDDADADRAVAIMNRHAAVYGEGTGATKKGAIGAVSGIAEKAKQALGMKEAPARERFDTREEEKRIPILKEEVHIGKREVERAHVHVSVRVAETPVSEHINLREERVVLERRPENRPLRADEIAFKNQELDITEYGEEPVVAKDVKVVEEVVVRKRIEERDEVVNDKVRSTYIDVSQGGKRR